MFALAAGVSPRVFPRAGVPSNPPRAPTPRSVARAVPATASGADPASSAAVARHHDLPAKVYIEHTDAYQVVYHASYFKFLRRGREAALFGHRARDDHGDDHHQHHHHADAPLAPDLLPPSCDTLLVVAVDDVVFARSATLGDDLIVRTRFLGAGERTLTLRQEVLRAADETLMLAATVVVAPTDAAGAPLGVGVGARVDAADDPAWLARSNGVCVDSDSVADSDPTIPGDDSPSATTEVTLFESELSLGNGASDADVLRWFERGRTDAIGGADALAELKEIDGIVVVVSKMNQGRFAPAVAGGGAPGWRPDDAEAGADAERGSSSAGSSTDASTGRGVRFGGGRMGRALVRSTVELRRRGLQVVFAQRLLVRGRDGEGWETAAAAEVTCTCLSRDSGRPTPCPPGLAERFAEVAAREKVKVTAK